MEWGISTTPLYEGDLGMNFNAIRTALAAVLILTIGCATGKTRVEGTSPSKSAPSQALKPIKKSKGTYSVQKGDTLWGLSSKESNYGDPFAWPLIFKSNKGKIQDPDLIYPHQELVIQKGFTAAEMAKAKKQAMDTPPYSPHTKPRETLPVNYDE